MIYLNVQNVKIKNLMIGLDNDFADLDELTNHMPKPNDLLCCLIDSKTDYDLALVQGIKSIKYFPDLLFKHPFSEVLLDEANDLDNEMLRAFAPHQVIILVTKDYCLTASQLSSINAFLHELTSFLNGRYSRHQLSFADYPNLRLTLTMIRSLDQALKYYQACGHDASLIMEKYQQVMPKSKEEVRNIYHEIYDELVA